MNETIRNAIIQELNLSNVSENVQDEVIAKLGSLIMEATVLSVAEQLPDELLESFEKVIGSQDEKAVSDFLAANVKNLQEILEKTSKEMIARYKSA
jgi:hypothetical protein